MSRPTHRGCALVITEPLIHSEVGVWWASVFMFIVVQSLSRVRLFATPWTAAHQASLSFTSSQSVLKLMSIESMMPSTVSSCHPLLLLPSVFSSISVFSIRVSVFTFIFFLVTRKSSSQLPRKNAQKPQEVRQIKSHYIHQLPQRPTMAQNVKKLLRGPVERRTTFSDENNKVGGSLDVSRTRVYACIPESGFYCGNICRVLVLHATPWVAVHQVSLSITISQGSLKFMSIESVIPSNHLILCRPLFPPSKYVKEGQIVPSTSNI